MMWVNEAVASLCKSRRSFIGFLVKRFDGVRINKDHNS